MRNKKSKLEIGWREWVALPELGVEKIKAKIDTGARTSAIDAKIIKVYEREGVERVRFEIVCESGQEKRTQINDVEIVDHRKVTDSGGHTEYRYVIKTPVSIGKKRKRIELTLTERRGMRFRMLLGRTAVRKDFVVNAGKSYLHDATSGGEPRS